MLKRYLLSPGPFEVPPEVLLEMARPVFHHRTPQFKEALGRAIEGLRYVFRTKGDVFIFASSGTGAMEACVANVLEAGGKAIVVRGGKFGERWGELCEAFGAEVVPLDVEWGDVVSREQVAGALKQHPDARAVYTTLSETSTGVLTDIKTIGEVVAQSNALLVVDGISSIGGVEFEMDAYKVDLLAVGSQKALMMPPGLAFLGVSEKAWKKIESTKGRRAYYFDLKAARKSGAKTDTPYTPAITAVMGLLKALELIREEGLENVWGRHDALAEATRAGAGAMGLELFSKVPANTVTAIRLPESVDGDALVKLLRDNYGVTIAGGQSQLKGKICRIAHMGYAGPFDVVTALAALEIGLKELGHDVTLGSGVAAAEEILVSRRNDWAKRS